MEMRAYWEILLRRKWIIIISFLLLPLLTFVILILLPPVYQSKAKLLINLTNFKQMFIKNVPPHLGQITFTDKDKIMNSIEAAIESTPVVGKVIEKLNLQDSKGDLLKLDNFIDPSITTILFKKRGVDIENMSATEIFEIRGYSATGSEAKLIADEVIHHFSTEMADQYRRQMAEIRKVLEKRIMEVEVQLKREEKSIAEFKTANQLYDVTTQTSMMISEIKDLETERDKASRAFEQSKASLKNLQEASWLNQQNLGDMTSHQSDNTVISGYKEQLEKLETSLAKMIKEKTDEDPVVKITKHQIDLVKENIRKEISKNIASQFSSRLSNSLVTGSSSFYNTLSTRYADIIISLVEIETGKKILDTQINSKQESLRNITEKTTKLSELQRRAGDLKTVYNSIFLDLETVRNTSDLDLTNAMVVQPADPGKYYFPHTFDDYEIYLGIAAVAGIFLGIFFAFLYDYLDRTLKTLDETKKVLNQGIVVKFPKVKRSQLNILETTQSPFTEPIYNFFTQANGFRNAKGGQAIAVVSTSGKAGNSTVAVHAACVLARGNKRVLLVDGNLRGPVLHEAFNIPNDKGLSDYLLNGLAAQDIVSKTFENNLDMITAGSVWMESPQIHLQSKKFEKLLEEMLKLYDFILFDTPPFSSGADGLIISIYARKVILVVRQGRTPQKAAKELVNMLEKENAAVWGVVVI